ncbi:S-adenosyl-L-methionine-dependent methyltransferase [Coniochaeta sp. 2T2.1]|nr:S-adenosyl-L-methionine-dependent methyltransferase [Coniochaeta sp. 2T2.1]
MSSEQLGRLQSTFQGSDLSAHGSRWDSLWKESYTPWDRGGPSLALADAILDRPELFPSPSPGSSSGQEKKRRTALVPGCGRGYDVLLLSALGYDVVGLDYSEAAVEEAARTEEAVREGKDKGVYDDVAGGRERGRVEWVRGDFFDDGWLGEMGKRGGGEGGFDLVFDYTVSLSFVYFTLMEVVKLTMSQFFCALPPEARPKWAKRMSGLLNPNTGRLICLEWPLGKDPSTGGPPWGLTAETYATHLSRPGEEVRYGEDGKPLADELKKQPSDTGLKCLTRFQPRRNHKANFDHQVSVWSH